MNASDRLASSLRRVNDALNPQLVFLAQWEYRVISAIPGPPVTIDCSAVDAETVATLPPQLVGLVLWPGASGIVAVPQPGTIVRISFVNGDPSKPTVVGLDPNGTPLLAMGFVSTVLQLGDQAAAPLVPATWGAAVDTALLGLATSLAAFTTSPPPLDALGALGNALGIALTPQGGVWPGPPPVPGTLPPGATTKLLGT